MNSEANERNDKLAEGVSGQKNSSYESQSVPFENSSQLDNKNLVFPEDDKNALSFIMEMIANGTNDFDVKRMVKFAADKMVGVYHYARNEGGLYELDRVKATLYHNIEIEPLVINGIDIKKLELEMKTMDWAFEKFRWGKDVEDALRLISRDEDGMRIAVALWNNIVPSAKFEKPEFIETIENDLGMYITRGFSGDLIRMKEIYAQLKERQLIDQKLLELPIDAVHNSKARLVMTEQLFKGEPLSLHLPINTSDRTKITFTWDTRSKQINLCDQEGNIYRVSSSMHFEKTKVERNLQEDFECAHRLRKYPIAEIKSAGENSLLVRELVAGKQCSVHFERTLIPSIIIESFQVVEHTITGDSKQIHEHKVLCSYPEYAKAAHDFHCIGAMFVKEPDKAASELLLVGQYSGKRLEYDLNGEPEKNTGYLIAIASDFSSNGYCCNTRGNASKAQTISEEMIIAYDKCTKVLNFYNLDLKDKDVDLSFWNRPSVKMADPKIKVDEGSLLVKCREANDRGVKR